MLGDRAWGLEALKQIGLAVITAVVVGYVGGKLWPSLRTANGPPHVEQIAILALAVLAYPGPS